LLLTLVIESHDSLCGLGDGQRKKKKKKKKGGQEPAGLRSRLKFAALTLEAKELALLNSASTRLMQPSVAA